MFLRFPSMRLFSLIFCLVTAMHAPETEVDEVAAVVRQLVDVVEEAIATPDCIICEDSLHRETGEYVYRIASTASVSGQAINCVVRPLIENAVPPCPELRLKALHSQCLGRYLDMQKTQEFSRVPCSHCRQLWLIIPANFAHDSEEGVFFRVMVEYGLQPVLAVFIWSWSCTGQKRFDRQFARDILNRREKILQRLGRTLKCSSKQMAFIALNQLVLMQAFFDVLSNEEQAAFLYHARTAILKAPDVRFNELFPMLPYLFKATYGVLAGRCNLGDDVLIKGSGRAMHEIIKDVFEDYPLSMASIVFDKEVSPQFIHDVLLLPPVIGVVTLQACHLHDRTLLDALFSRQPTISQVVIKNGASDPIVIDAVDPLPGCSHSIEGSTRIVRRSHYRAEQEKMDLSECGKMFFACMIWIGVMTCIVMVVAVIVDVTMDKAPLPMPPCVYYQPIFINYSLR